MKTDLIHELPDFFSSDASDKDIFDFIWEVNRKVHALEGLAFHQKLHEFIKQHSSIELYWQMHMDGELNEREHKDYGVFYVVHWLVRVEDTFYSLNSLKEIFNGYCENGMSQDKIAVDAQTIDKLSQLKKEIQKFELFHMPYHVFQYYRFYFPNNHSLIQLEQFFIQGIYSEILNKETLDFRAEFLERQKNAIALNVALPNKDIQKKINKV